MHTHQCVHAPWGLNLSQAPEPLTLDDEGLESPSPCPATMIAVGLDLMAYYTDCDIPPFAGSTKL